MVVLQGQSCLITIRPKMHQIRGDLQAVFFSEPAKTIVIAADNKAPSSVVHTFHSHMQEFISCGECGDTRV